MIRFDWDENKNKSNRKKHGVWFEEAQSVFDDLNGRIFLDVQNSDYEDRFILIGVNNFLKLLVVVHCQRESGTVIRLISARKATRKEREFYEEGI